MLFTINTPYPHIYVFIRDGKEWKPVPRIQTLWFDPTSVTLSWVSYGPYSQEYMKKYTEQFKGDIELNDMRKYIMDLILKTSEDIKEKISLLVQIGNRGWILNARVKSVVNESPLKGECGAPVDFKNGSHVWDSVDIMKSYNLLFNVSSLKEILLPEMVPDYREPHTYEALPNYKLPF